LRTSGTVIAGGPADTTLLTGVPGNTIALRDRILLDDGSDGLLGVPFLSSTFRQSGVGEQLAASFLGRSRQLGNRDFLRRSRDRQVHPTGTSHLRSEFGTLVDHRIGRLFRFFPGDVSDDQTDTRQKLLRQ
jgi:hypothetical protein